MKLGDTDIELTQEDMQGQIEKHHIVFRSHGGTNYDLNIICLPSSFHKGTNGPHHNRETDLILKRSMENQLWLLFRKSFYSISDVIRMLDPWDKKSRVSIEKQIKKQNVCTSKGYHKEDIIRTLMGGKLYV